MTADRDDKQEFIALPEPDLRGALTLEEALQKRESYRRFSGDPLSRKELSQVLWAAQGLTRGWGARTAPSAGALFPLETYAVLADGVYHYLPGKHEILRLSDLDRREVLAAAALGQEFIRQAPVTIATAVVLERIARKYGSRGERYALIEAGHAAQNVLLEATALGLGAVPVGAFHDEAVRKALGLPEDHKPVYLIPVGHKRK